jgi:nitrate reductase molybdenum cofactor assembly chaperone NarJ/NarW
MRLRRRADPVDRRVLHQVTSLLLNHPDARLIEQLPLLRRALDEAGVEDDGLRALIDHLAGTPLGELQASYAEVFDLNRRHALHLSYWTDGDTRRRGEALGRFKSLYRDSGWLVDTGGELPDHLALVLEYAAVVDPEAGLALLLEYRPGLELLKFNLIDAGTPWAAAVVAVCASLPGESPADRSAAYALAPPPTTETVGLEPFDRRLLPVLPSQTAVEGALR